MVHALEEIHRVLIPGGALIDLRPMTEEWPVEIVTVKATQLVGNVSPLPEDVEADRAADRSFQQLEARGFFQRGGQVDFAYDYLWDSPSEMKDYVESEWDDWVTISKDRWANIRAAWAVADGDASLRVPVRLILARWNKRG